MSIFWLGKALFEVHTWKVRTKKVTQYHQKSDLRSPKIGLQTYSQEVPSARGPDRKKARLLRQPGLLVPRTGLELCFIKY